MMMETKFKRILNFLKANDSDSYLVRRKLKAAEQVAKRNARDAEGDKEDTGLDQWKKR